MLGDVGVTARLLADALPADPSCLDHRPEVAESWAIWRAEKARRRGDDLGADVSSAAVFAVMSGLVPEDAVLCFAAFASLCGAAGYRVAKADELADALVAAIAHPGPALVEVVADPLLV